MPAYDDCDLRDMEYKYEGRRGDRKEMIDRDRINQRNHELAAGLELEGARGSALEKTLRRIFAFFADFSAIPHGSGNVAAVVAFLEGFASERGLEHIRDDVRNVVIRKPAQGSGAQKGVILQAHLDMVCVKESD